MEQIHIIGVVEYRSGDIRGNYTDFVLFKFDYPEQWFEVVDEITMYECGGSREINGKEYIYDLSIFSEYVRVWCRDTREQFEIYAYNDKSFDEEIIKAEKEIAEN